MRVCALVAFCMAWAAFWATGIHPVLESWASCLIYYLSCLVLGGFASWLEGRLIRERS